MTENEVLKDLQNYQGILKAKTRINASVNPEIALGAITEAIEVIGQYRAIGTIEEFKALKEKNEPKMGKWNFDSITATWGKPYRCSECDEEYEDTYNYCPNCGAKMY